ncbi:MAG: FAD-binding protein [Deltaproteobacteria bacterium]|nr:FAD-binding protein [Deltaproteobacteria bacterium]
MDERLCHRLEQLLGATALPREAALYQACARDESNLGSYPPDAVVVPADARELALLLEFAGAEGVPVTPRGAGTGKSGGALAVRGGIVVSTARMNRLLEIDEADLVAVVEPGLITGALCEAVQERGLFYPPDPASLLSCSLGGNVAENAGGPRAFKYGVTRHYTLALEVALIGGQRLSLGRRSTKSVTGYDLVGLMVGSEGTLGVISKITLRLIPLPMQQQLFVAMFDDAVAAGTAVTRLVTAGVRPSAMELLDAQIVEHLRQSGRWSARGQVGAILMVELDGPEEGAVERLERAAGLTESAGASEVVVATDAGRCRALWEMRRQVSVMLRDACPHKLSEDIAVPCGALPEMLRRLDRIAVDHQLEVAAYGHAGDGNLHVNILSPEPLEPASRDAVLLAIFRAAISLGGTLSGEHGIGLAKRDFLPLEQEAGQIAVQRQLKRVFDPQELLNPGKIFPDA